MRNTCCYHGVPHNNGAYLVFEFFIEMCVDFDVLALSSSIPLSLQSHPYVRESEECRTLVIETLKFLYDLDMDMDGSKGVDLSHPLVRPRIPHEIVFAVGGWSGSSPTNAIEAYDTRADRWISVDYIDKGNEAG